MNMAMRSGWLKASTIWHASLQWRLLFPIMLGLLFALGDEVVATGGHLYPTRPQLYVKAVIYMAVFAAAFILVERGAALLTARDRFESRSSIWFGWSPRSVAIGAAGIAACWLPYLMAQYPGVYWSDTSRQLVMYYGGEPVMDQHPFFTTYLFGWFADLGQLLFSDRIAGLYVLIVIQAAAMAVLLAVMTCYIRRIGTPRWLCRLTYGIVALFPLFPVMFSSLAKDTVNAVFLLPFMMMVAEIIRTKGSCLCRPWFAALLAADSLLVCLTKKTGVYVVAVTLLALCLIAIGARLRIMLAGLAAAMAVIMAVFIPNILFPALRIQPGGQQEMVPVVAQQLAHDLKYNGDDYSGQDRAIVDGFFEYGSETMAEQYNPFQADAIKGMYTRHESSLADVLGLWLRKTIEHPLGHLEAWLSTSHGWITFRGPDNASGCLLPYFASNWYSEQVTDYMSWPRETERNRGVQIVYDTMQGIPVINVLFHRAFWATMVPCLLCYLACGLPRGERRRAWLMLVPLLVSTATLFIAGVSGLGGEPTRYVLTSMIMIPVVVGFVASCRFGGATERQCDASAGMWV